MTFVFLAFALGFYLNGCNSAVSKTCILYKPFSNGIVYKKVKDPYESHSVCTSKCGSSCCGWTTTQYYNAYVYAHKGPTNSTYCYLEVANNVTSIKADNALNSYSIGQHVDWLKDKYDNECVTSETAYIYWVVGIVCFSLMGAVALFGIAVVMYSVMTSNEIGGGIEMFSKV
jgi:hypothetical protein